MVLFKRVLVVALFSMFVCSNTAASDLLELETLNQTMDDYITSLRPESIKDSKAAKNRTKLKKPTKRPKKSLFRSVQRMTFYAFIGGLFAASLYVGLLFTSIVQFLAAGSTFMILEGLKVPGSFLAALAIGLPAGNYMAHRVANRVYRSSMIYDRESPSGLLHSIDNRVLTVDNSTLDFYKSARKAMSFGLEAGNILNGIFVTGRALSWIVLGGARGIGFAGLPLI